MYFTLGIRREDKNKWERRVPLIPKHIKELKEKFGIEAKIQPSIIRKFSEKDFKDAGAIIDENLSSSHVVFAIKEIPIDFFEPGKTYVFFSHTTKGQKHNLPMLKKMMKLKCNLIDYEKITDEKGRRLVFFGRFAGLAGMIDTLWAFGQKIKWKGVKNPFTDIKQTINYKDLADAKAHIMKIGKKIEQDGLDYNLTPFVVGFAGYGNASKGAQEILDILPVKNIKPNQLKDIKKNFSKRVIYKVVFKEKDMVEPISTKNFDLQEYYNNPHLYRSVFHRYIEYLDILMNCIYWSEKYPSLITKNFLKKNYTNNFKLQVIGDISVDIKGAIEFTEKFTNPEKPIFIYNPLNDEITDGFEGEGIAVMAVDNLPCEIPKESSQAFSKSLFRFVPSIVKTDFSTDFNSLNLPSEIKKAVILYHGKLTPDYQYINKFL